jgi:hypothetical protein
LPSFRLSLDKLTKPFEAQSESIKQITQRFNVTYMAVDTTGIGQGVYQLVRQFYPAAVALNYSPEVKGRLVLKGLRAYVEDRYACASFGLVPSYFLLRTTQ